MKVTFVGPVGGRNAFVSVLLVAAKAIGWTGAPAVVVLRKPFVLPPTMFVLWTTLVANKTRFVSELFVVPFGPRKTNPGVE